MSSIVKFDSPAQEFFTDALDGDTSLVPEILGAYLKAGVVGGEVYFAEHMAAGIVGVAIWFPPSTTALGTYVFFRSYCP